MDYFVIDVREPEEYASGHVQGAVNVPPALLMAGPTELRDLPKDTKLIVYCRTGSRSNVAAHILRQLGFTDITNGINKEHVEARYGL